MSENSIKRMLDFFHNGNMMEVRMLNVPNGGVVRGYYDDYEKLEKDIQYYNGTVNIYMTLNAINPDIEIKYKNKLEKFAKQTTKDSDIIKRRWLMIDFDPRRETNTSSTADELKSAEVLMKEVLEFLSENGFSRPVKAMSGNGYHLLYPIDLENNRENTSLIRNFLRTLSERFSTEKVEIDKTTYNASRITKLYGSISCKGKHSDERPYRITYVCSRPKELVPIDVSIIKEVVSLLTNNQGLKTQRKLKSNKDINAEQWLKERNIAVDRIKKEEDRIVYVLKECPWNPEHKDKSAYVIQYEDGGISAGCHHDSCSEENWMTLQKIYTIDSNETQMNEVEKSEKRSQTDSLMDELEAQGHIFFHDCEGMSYVEIPGDSHKFMVLDGPEYEKYIRHFYYEKYKKTLKSDSIKQLIATLDAIALYGEEREVYTRCAYINDSIYYYLADSDENLIVIDKSGYRICKNVSIPFVKRDKMRPQVLPIENEYSLQDITAKYWCFHSEKYKILHDVLLVTRFVAHIVPVIGMYVGQMGSAKTTSMIQDKLVVDPNAVMIRVIPNNIRDLVLVCRSQYLVCLDNVGKINSDVNDLICVSSTGGYYSVKLLYMNRELNDVKVDTKLNITGINIPSNRPDFFDRTCVLELERLSEENRKTLEEVLDSFKAELPYLLDAIFKILSKAMNIKEQIKVKKLPRMADWSLWGYAIAEALGYGGEAFLDAYRSNNAEVDLKVLEEDPLGSIILSLCKKHGYIFEGNMSEIWQDIKNVARDCNIDLGYGFPQNASALSRRLGEIEPILKNNGIIFIKKKSNGIRQSYLGLAEEFKE